MLPQGALVQALAPFYWIMYNVQELSPVCFSVPTEALEFTTVSIQKMQEWCAYQVVCLSAVKRYFYVHEKISKKEPLEKFTYRSTCA